MFPSLMMYWTGTSLAAIFPARSSAATSLMVRPAKFPSALNNRLAVSGQNDANLLHHHVSFADAARVFALPEQFRFTPMTLGTAMMRIAGSPSAFSTRA
jgi:hypothetical protein